MDLLIQCCRRSQVIGPVNGIHCAQRDCTIKMWLGMFRLNIWWSCSINSWLDVILKYTSPPPPLLCFVTKVCRQVLFEWIVWTAWIVLIVYSPSLHWRWVCQRTFCGCLYCIHCLFHGKDRKEGISLSYTSLSCQLYDTEWCWLENLGWG